MHNILRRQNEVTEGEKRLKCDYYRKEIKKQNLVTQNNVSIIAPCREVYISLQNPQCETKELWRDVLWREFIYTRCVIALVHMGHI